MATKREMDPEDSREDDISGESDEPQGLKDRLLSAFDRFASHVTKATGHPVAFATAFGAVLIWAVSGPVFGFSETWQLVINTGTTIVTFLMVFLIQQSQNKDSEAVHLKLDELIRSQKRARQGMIDIEDLSEAQLDKLAQQFKRGGRKP